ncbi:MAG: hypothetical protein WCO52_00545 [bacterium]
MDPKAPAAPAQPEELVAQWTEPTRVTPPNQQQFTLQVFAGASVVTVLMLLLGYFQQDITFYMAAVAAVAAGIFLVTQRRRVHPSLEIALTTTRLVVGKHEYPLGTLAGFWLQEDLGQLLVNIEPSKAATYPVCFLYANDNEEEARQILHGVMAEVEPRKQTTADAISRYFRI